MTAVAAVAEPATVRVVAAVAGNAILARLARRVCAVGMTGATRHVGMGTGQRKRGLVIVVEPPGAPGQRVVTIGTTLAEAAAMRIVVGMARLALNFDVVKRRRRMTAAALELRVGAD